MREMRNESYSIARRGKGGRPGRGLAITRIIVPLLTFRRQTDPKLNCMLTVVAGFVKFSQPGSGIGSGRGGLSQGILDFFLVLELFQLA